MLSLLIRISKMLDWINCTNATMNTGLSRNGWINGGHFLKHPNEITE